MESLLFSSVVRTSSFLMFDTSSCGEGESFKPAEPEEGHCKNISADSLLGVEPL